MADVDVITELLQQYSALIVAVTGAAAGTLWIWRKVRPIVQLVEAQLSPNGGGSLTDKVDQIAPNHAAAEEHWKRLEDNQIQIKTDLIASNEELGRKFDDRVDKIQAELDRRETFARAAIRRLPDVSRETLEELYRDTGPKP